VSAADVVVLIAAAVACVAGVVVAVAAGILVGQVRRLERGIEALRGDAVPLVREARLAADHAVEELRRVDAVLADTESVTATVDRAAQLAARAFANPVVKALAWRAGAVGGWRSLRGLDGPGEPARAGVRVPTRAPSRRGADGHRSGAAAPTGRRADVAASGRPDTPRRRVAAGFRRRPA
jgi:hypothetical protein